MNSCHSQIYLSLGWVGLGQSHDHQTCRMLAILPIPGISLKFNDKISVFNDALWGLWEIGLHSFLSHWLSWLCPILLHYLASIHTSRHKQITDVHMLENLLNWLRFKEILSLYSISVIQYVTLSRYSMTLCLVGIDEISQFCDPTTAALTEIPKEKQTFWNSNVLLTSLLT